MFLSHINHALVKNCHQTFRKIYKLSNFKQQKMAEHCCVKKTSLEAVLSKLTEFAPLSYASSWDNVGLLVDPGSSSTTIDNILLTNDLTEDVVDEAVGNKCGLIVSYHPNIFQGMKCVTQRTWKERIVVTCLKNNIAVFSPHTTWDAAQGGVNDWLADSLPVAKSSPILPVPSDSSIGAGRLCTLKESVKVKEAVKLIKKHIGIGHLRLALARSSNQDAEIKTVALCAGSGSSVLNGINADLYLTGEMLHHDVLDATQKGIHVILCNHSDSERGFLHQFRSRLENEMLGGQVKVFVSKVDRDPLTTV